MTLRARFGLAAALFAAAVVASFGVAVHLSYRQHLERHLTQVLVQDLERVASLLDRPVLGASFTRGGATGDILQVVAGGTVLFGWGDPAPLLAVERPTRVERGGRAFLVAQVPWRAAHGSIRLAHDVTAATEGAAAVARALIVSGTLVVLAAALVALGAVRRLLRPLTDLARQTRLLDPAAPGSVTYRGPRDEGYDLAAGLNAALAAIRRRREAEHAFLLEVAHELSAPLTLVHYHLDGLRRRDPADPSLRAASEAARELLRTSQDLMLVARGELERPIEHRVVDLREVAARMSDEYPGVRVEAPLAAEVVGDAERLTQVVRNLVRNAAQASGGSAGVRVVVRGDGDDQLVEVIDVGHGMSDEARVRAFERGFSGGRGVGVGLTVAKSIVEGHGGEVRIAATTEAGTVMEVRIPSLASRLEPAPEAVPRA